MTVCINVGLWCFYSSGCKGNFLGSLTRASVDIFFWGSRAPAIWISKGPKQNLKGPSNWIHYLFFNFGGPIGLSGKISQGLHWIFRGVGPLPPVAELPGRLDVNNKNIAPSLHGHNSALCGWFLFKIYTWIPKLTSTCSGVLNNRAYQNKWTLDKICRKNTVILVAANKRTPGTFSHCVNSQTRLTIRDTVQSIVKCY